VIIKAAKPYVNPVLNKENSVKNLIRKHTYTIRYNFQMILPKSLVWQCTWGVQSNF